MCNPSGESDSKTPKKELRLTRKEVQAHNTKDSKWIIINNKVYDITSFCKRHPGGARVISHAAGEDATVSGAHLCRYLAHFLMCSNINVYWHC